MNLTQVKTAAEIKAMRKSGKILAVILDELVASVKVGMRTIELDKLARQLLTKHQAQSAFLGYQVGKARFPATLCVSINNEIVHGLPSDQVINNGSVVGLDFGVTYDGMITDAARTVVVGKADKAASRLVAGTEQALNRAIDVIRDGVRVGDISEIIENTLTKHNLKPIYSLTGHGVGHQLHEDPPIPNYGTKGTGQVLRAGMTVAIEPIASLSTNELYLADDGWTYMTQDGSLSAQFENTVLITKNGCEILTT